MACLSQHCLDVKGLRTATGTVWKLGDLWDAVLALVLPPPDLYAPRLAEGRGGIE